MHAFVWIIALAMFGVRLGGIHMHLCFDGQEPPASLHVEHEHGHQDHHHSEDSQHQDQDVDLLAQGFVKKADLGGLDALTCAFGIVTLLPAGHEFEPERFTTVQPTGPPHFRLPPLRGPPA